jgi:hypothetical protein
MVVLEFVRMYHFSPYTYQIRNLDPQTCRSVSFRSMQQLKVVSRVFEPCHIFLVKNFKKH